MAQVQKPSAPIVFTDGSKATPLDDKATLTTAEATASRIDVELSKGGARFEVTKNPARIFRVRAGNVSVEVLGTEFIVEHVVAEHVAAEHVADGATSRVRVSVVHGRVRVAWGDQQAELVDGQMSVFPPEAKPQPSVSAAPEGDVGTTSEAGAAPTTSASSPTTTATTAAAWKALAREGDFDKAYSALEASGGAVRDEPGELLLAADVARLSHHPAAALPHLRQVVSKHAGDPRAALAAFTLGRVLLEELGRPKEAADAFAQSRALGPGGPLAEDALAREVEAWWRAGDTTRAHARAEDYVAKYPSGLRIRSVKKYGGIE
jgi:transmembrane sensor